MSRLRHLYGLISADLKLTTIYEQSARHFDVVRAHPKTDDLFARPNSIVSTWRLDFRFCLRLVYTLPQNKTERTLQENFPL